MNPTAQRLARTLNLDLVYVAPWAAAWLWGGWGHDFGLGALAEAARLAGGAR